MQDGSQNKASTDTNMALAESWTELFAEPEPEDYTADSTQMPGNATDTDATTVPSRTKANEELWGVWWPIHRYGFGTLFTILCVYALYATVLRIVRNRAVGSGVRSRKAVQPVFTCINFLILFLGFSNSVVLFFDAYRLYGGLPFVMSVVLSNMPYPCMTSAFALVNWVLISISQMRITRASKLRSVGFLLIVIMSHFLLVIGASLVLVYLFPVLVLGLACHGFFVVWGWLLCLTYIYSAWKIMVVDKTNRKTLRDISVRDGSVAAANNSVQSKLGSKIPCGIIERLVSMFSRRKRQQDYSDEKAVFTVGQTPSSSCLEYDNKITDVDGVTDDDIKTKNEKESSLSDATEPQQNGRNEEPSKQGSDQKPETKNTDVNSMKTGPDFSKRNGLASPVVDKQNGNKTSGMNTKQQNKMGPKSGGKMSGTGRPQNSTQKVFRISAVTAFLGVTASGLGLYGILNLMLASPEDKLTGWPWLIYQSLARAVEFGMGCTMAYFTTQPFPRRRER